jgi:hypothetical protein|tara:strand:+ start:185 stop:370 length:186 start_codon:yes stop_codon:yes gene_type:complete
MAGFGIALRGLGKALKSKKARDAFGLFSVGAVTGSLLGEATTKKTKPRKKLKKKFPKHGAK